MEIKLIKTERVLALTQINLADYVINPYRGCSFGCLYCYSQKNKNILDPNFRNCVGVKINAPAVLEKELKKIKPKKVLLGSTTECFQEVEEKYKISKQILEVLNKEKIPYLILTKSPLIRNYLDIISLGAENEIYFTLNIASQKIIKLLEPNSLSLALRLDAIKEILSRKIKLRIHVGPFIPFVSNLKSILKLLPQNVNAVNIEIYHKKMGSFDIITKVIEKKLGSKKAEKLTDVYLCKENYSKYTQNLKKKIIQIKRKKGIDFFYLIPEFGQYYNASLDYNNQIKI